MAPKSAEARRGEADRIAAQLDDVGVPEDALRDMKAELERFAAQGLGCTRTWKFPEVGAAVSLLLSTQAHITSYARVHRA